MAPFGHLGFGDMRGADEEAGIRHFARALGGEQVAEILPVEIVDIIAEGAGGILGALISGDAALLGLDHVDAGGGGFGRRARPARNGRGYTCRIMRHPPGRGIGVGECRDRAGRRCSTIGGRIAGRYRLGDPALRPALRIVGLHARREVHLGDAPDAVAFDVTVLEGGGGPIGLAVIDPGHAEIEPARPRLAPIGADRDDQVDLDVIVERTGLQPLRPVAIEPAADALRADPGADAVDREGRILLEQVGDIAPHLLVDIVTIDILEVRNGLLLPEPFEPAVQRRQAAARRQRRSARWGDQPGGVGGVVIGHDFQVALQIAPAIGVSAGELGIIMEVGDLPDPAFLSIVILVDAAGPAGVAAEAAEHRQFVPAAVDRAAVGVEIEHRGQREHISHAAFGQAVLAATIFGQQIGPDRVAALDRPVAELCDGILGEQVRHLAPQAIFGILRIGDLEPPGSRDPLDLVGRVRQCGEAGRGGRRGVGRLERKHGQGGERQGEAGHAGSPGCVALADGRRSNVSCQAASAGRVARQPRSAKRKSI